MLKLKKLRRFLRPFVYSNEIILSEQFAFGHREVYQRFLNFNPKKILLAELQHGWYLNPTWTPQGNNSQRQLNKKLKLFPLLVWSRELAANMNKDRGYSVYPISSPWSLITRNYEIRKRNKLAPDYKEKKGSVLYFPAHSIPGMQYDLNFEAIKKIGDLQKFKFVTTSLYWTDFLDPMVRERFGSYSNVTCMGLRSPSSIDAPWHDIGGRVNFLYQLHKSISEHEFIVTDEIGTAAMASVVLGKKVYITQKKVYYNLIHRSEKQPMLCIDNEDILNRYGIVEYTDGLGYKISENPEILELARSGFGYDISLEETGKTVERYLGDSNFSLPGFHFDDYSSTTLW
jgi:hypothetical protein